MRNLRLQLMCGAICGVLGLAAVAGAEPVAPDLPDARAHSEAARALSMNDPFLRWPYQYYCVTGYRVTKNLRPGMGTLPWKGGIISTKGWVPRSALKADTIDVPPTRVFDNLYYVGNNFIGMLVFKTTAGLVVVDTMWSASDVDHFLVPGLRKFGMDVKDTKLIILTHQHADHYGGINRLLELAPDAKVVTGKPDADALLTRRAAGLAPDASPEQKATFDALPRRIDMEVVPFPGLKNGEMDLTVGNTTFRLILVPSHTVGMISVIAPVTWHGVPHMVAIWGGDHIDNPNAPQKALQYASSLEFFHSITELAGVDATIQPHIYQNDDLRLLDKVRAHPTGPNPFVIGRDRYDRYLSVWTQCMEAFGRRTAEGTWKRF